MKNNFTPIKFIENVAFYSKKQLKMPYLKKSFYRTIFQIIIFIDVTLSIITSY